MDQLRQILAGLKKYHVWLLCLVVVGTVLGSWYQATDTLTAERQRRRGDLDAKFSGVQPIPATVPHPNEQYIQRVQQLTRDVEQEILTGWRTLYGQQQIGVPEHLSAESKAALEGLAAWSPVPRAVRRLLLSDMRPAFEALFQDLDLRLKKENDFDGLIVWSGEQRKDLADRYDWTSEPTDSQVWYAIEDYFIYRQLIAALNAMNEGASDHLAATVKQVKSLEIGQIATGTEENTGNADADGFIRVFKGGNVKGHRGIGRFSGLTPPKNARDSEDPYRDIMTGGRYVTVTGQPIPKGQPDPYPHYRLMPVRLNLVIDQRRLPRVLAKLAGTPSPLKVLQVEVNRGTAFDPLKAPKFDGKDSKRRYDETNWGTGGKGSNREANGLELLYNDVAVEIKAVLYLFKQPPAPPEGSAEPARPDPAKTAASPPAGKAAAAVAAADPSAAPPPAEAAAEPPPAAAEPAADPTPPSDPAGSK